MKPDSGFGNLPELAIDVTSEDGLASSVPLNFIAGQKSLQWPRLSS